MLARVLFLVATLFAAPVLAAQSEDNRSMPVADVDDAAIYREIENQKAIIDARLDAMDRALAITQGYPTQLDRVMTDLRTQMRAMIDALESLHDQRFGAIDRDLVRRDDHLKEIQSGLSSAMSTAFEAQKELVESHFQANAAKIDKLESSMNKSIDQLNVLIDQSNANTSSKIDDLKTRVQSIESRSQGAGDTVAWIFAGAGFFSTVLAIVGAIAVVIWHRPVDERRRAVVTGT